VFAHLLYQSQLVGELRRAQDERRWTPVRTKSWSGSLLGVAGLGCIGSAVAQFGLALGMKVRGLVRSPGQSKLGAPHEVFAIEQLDAFLDGLDVLVVALPITPKTRGMIRERELRRMAGGSTVINIARGGIVDEVALERALRQGPLAHAVLDVFETEPLATDSPLWGCPNLTVTPHMAGAAYAPELVAVCVRNLRTFLSGHLPGPLVDIGRGY
jgi:phosphoglycerate dehydrogenase-like enzyme